MERSSGLPTRLTGKRVLLVEDEALVSMLVEDGLHDAGAEVVGPAFSVDHAMRLVEAEAAEGGISAAVLDINLQGHPVAPVADRLLALGVPFLFATGYADGRDTCGHGTAPVLHKPFGVEALVAAVEALASAGAARGQGGHERTGNGEDGPRARSRAVAVRGTAFAD